MPIVPDTPPGNLTIGMTGFNERAAEQIAYINNLMTLLNAASGFLTGDDRQSSATDTTADALLKVGAFGLGSASAPLITDFTAELQAGFYSYYEHTSAGAPGSGQSFYGSCFVSRGQDERTVVIAHRVTTSSPKSWIGVRSSATGAFIWREVYHQGSVLGTVGQSGGVPTGAIIERGSNANGEYTKYADGTLECWHTLSPGSSVALGDGSRSSPYRTSDFGWTFPSAFSATPSVTATARADDNGAIRLHFVSLRSVTATSIAQANVVRFSDVSTALSPTVHAVAHGRWF